jgi:hypothetical protein
MDQPNTEPSSTHPASESTVGGAAVPAAQQRTWNDSFNQLDGYAEQLRVKLPVAPPGLLDGYMKVAPWIAIIFGVLAFLGSLALMGLGAILSPFLLFGGAEGVSAGGALFLALIVGLISAALEVVGGYLMLQRRATGWWVLALGLAVSFLTNLIHGTILVLIVVALVAYVHLQVKPNYH